ncbi:hypothetical protein BGZ83_004689 [Gryganskiella cystojenkinii]|nr:hypothetical protein BGZ83_004689 [Gryganskiella cystojenkinii]
MEPTNSGTRPGHDSRPSLSPDPEDTSNHSPHSKKLQQNDENQQQQARATASTLATRHRESHRYYRDMLATRATSRSTDTLDVYTSYVSWIFRTDGHISGRQYLVQILKDAVDRFAGLERFKNDPRYVRLYLSYGNYYGGSYYDVLQTMESLGVGTEIAFFYEAFARCQVLSAEFDNARATLLRGLRRKAKPIKQMERFYEEFEATMKEYLQTRARKNEATVEPSGRRNNESIAGSSHRPKSQGLLQSRTNRNIPASAPASASSTTGMSGGSRLQSSSSSSSIASGSTDQIPRRPSDNKENVGGSGRSRTERDTCTAATTAATIPSSLTKHLLASEDWESRFPVKQEGEKWTRSLFDFNAIYHGGQEYQNEEIRARLPKYTFPRPSVTSKAAIPTKLDTELEQHEELDMEDDSSDDCQRVLGHSKRPPSRDKGKGRAVDLLLSSSPHDNRMQSPPPDLPADRAQKMQSYLQEDQYNVFDSDEDDLGTSRSPTMHTVFAADRMNKLFSHDTNLSAEQIFGTPWGEDETEDLRRDELDNFTMAYSIPTRALANTAEYSIPSLGFSNAAELDGPPVEVGSDDEIDLTSITLAIQAMKRKNMERGSQDDVERSGKMRSRLERELERQRYEAEAGPSDITLDLRHQRLLLEERQHFESEQDGQRNDPTPARVFHDDTGALTPELNVPMLEDEAPPSALESHDETI